MARPMNGGLHVGLIIQQDLAAGPLPMICAPSAPWLMVAYVRENDLGCRCGGVRRAGHMLSASESVVRIELTRLVGWMPAT